MLTLTYSSTQLLNCGPCRTGIIVCVRPELMLSGAPYIDGALLGTTHSRASNGENVYTYRIDYDETLLAPPTVRLNSCDVRGLVCRGCLTDYVDYQTNVSGETPNTGVDTSSINTTASGVLGRNISADLIVSPDAGNTLQVLPNGVYVPEAGADVPNTALDTTSINTTASGVLGRIISSTLIVSAQVGNALSVLPDGAYVAPAGADTPNTATDSNSINITLTGLLGRNIQADAIISPNAGNLLSILGNGLFAGGFVASPICPSAYFVGSPL